MRVSTRFKPTRQAYEDPGTAWRRETAPEVLQGKSRTVAAQAKKIHEPFAAPIRAKRRSLRPRAGLQ